MFSCSFLYLLNVLCNSNCSLLWCHVFCKKKQVLLEDGVLHRFFIVAKYENRCIVSYHIIPETEVCPFMIYLVAINEFTFCSCQEQQQQFPHVIENSRNLHEVMEGLSNIDSQSRDAVARMSELLSSSVREQWPKKTYCEWMHSCFCKINKVRLEKSM